MRVYKQHVNFLPIKLILWLIMKTVFSSTPHCECIIRNNNGCKFFAVLLGCCSNIKKIMFNMFFCSFVHSFLSYLITCLSSFRSLSTFFALFFSFLYFVDIVMHAGRSKIGKVSLLLAIESHLVFSIANTETR